MRRDLTIDLGLRYDRQTLTDATKNFAPRVGFGWHPGGDSRLSIRGGYGMYYTQIQSNLIASYLVNGLDGLTTYTATPGQLGFPTCLTGSCLPLSFDPKTLPASQLPARDITIQAGRRAFYEAQFAKYGLNFDLLPNYPDKLVNPRSQVVSIGAEREVVKGLFAGADYVHQHWTDLDRTVDLNAPSPFDRTAPGQVQNRGRGQCHPSHPAGQRRRAPGQRADESRRRRLRRIADPGQLPRQPAHVRRGQLHAVQGDQHHRTGRQRHRAEREQHRAPGRGRTRTEPARSASSRGHHVPATSCRSTSRPAR